MHGLVLLIPDKPDEERDAVAAAWEQRGGTVLRLGRFWDPPALDPAGVRVYGGDTFCLVLAEKLGLRLVSPDDRALSNALRGLLGRSVQIQELGLMDAGPFPAFVKPVVPKQFRGAVYTSIVALAEETRGLDPAVEVMVSEVVKFTAEARAFALDGEVRACAIYEGEGDVSHAAVFARVAAGAMGLPRTCVVDVGLLEDGRWVVVECNATWGAGLNGCDAAAAVDCIAAACGHQTTAERR